MIEQAMASGQGGKDDGATMGEGIKLLTVSMGVHAGL
jgi:hypothetical protein